MAKPPQKLPKMWKEAGSDPLPPNRRSKDECGSLGRPIRLTTNHFPVEVTKKNLTLYQFDVTIKDYMGCEKLPKKKNMLVFEKLKTSFPLVFGKVPLAYDSMKSAYSTAPISQCNKKACEWKVSLMTEVSESKPEHETKKNNSTYTVKMVKASQANLSSFFKAMKFSEEKQNIPENIVQMMEVMFRHYRAKIYEQVSRRNFFSLEGEFAQPHYIGGGKEGVTGFFGSLRPAAWKDGSILLNLNMAHSAFYKVQPVIDFLKENFEDIGDSFFTKPMSSRDLLKANKFIKGLRIRVTHAKRTYKVLKLNSLGADRIKFDYTDKNGQTKKVTVVEYMQKHYNIRLKYPTFNCLHVGNPEKDINIPIELCEIDKGQRVMKKLTDKETANFIRSSAVAPGERLRQIKEVASKNNFANDEMLKALTFKISDQPLQLDGRILPTPELEMTKQQKLTPFRGVWELRDQKFYNASKLETWAVINYDGSRTNMNLVRRFVGDLVKMGRDKGMDIKPPFDIYEVPRNKQPNPKEDFVYYKNQKPKDLQLIMCIIPAKNLYGAIKKAGDTEVNITTQCVVGKNVEKCQPQTIGNILLKINAKLGGTNNIVIGSPGLKNQYIKEMCMFSGRPLMVMGADVNHPPAGDSSTPSIAAVVGSYDRHFTKYALERRKQPSREEMISDLTEITLNLLKTFSARNNGYKPERIIMFRDGVSESQFAKVLAFEMLAMRAACTKFLQGYEPGITFICVQKRHHTRLFCDEKEGIGKSKNVPPGTIVDKHITHPTETDFYLCSHQGIQGTSRPTHYHLLWDDSDFSIDDLQMLTYKLCHVYVRCTRAVSIPAPVYYAHWAAYRAKVYISELLGSGSDSGSTFSGQSELTAEMDCKIREAVHVMGDYNNLQSFAAKLHYI